MSHPFFVATSLSDRWYLLHISRRSSVRILQLTCADQNKAGNLFLGIKFFFLASRSLKCFGLCVVWNCLLTWLKILMF